MIRNVLSHIGGVEVYGILSILLFFAFFTGMLVWAFRLKAGHLDAMGQLPLRDGDPAAKPGPRTVDNPSPSNLSSHSSASRPCHECE